jgi:hypothetical protein
MKLTTLVLSLFFSTVTSAQPAPPLGPTPPVPGAGSTTKDVTGDMVVNPNEVATESSKGSIKKARVYFVEPKDGATVRSPVVVKVAAEGVKILKARDDSNDITSGHIHLAIDGKPTDAGKALPMGKNTVHLMDGETQATLRLSPGEHHLTVQFGDAEHKAFGPKLSQTIRVIVK